MFLRRIFKGMPDLGPWASAAEMVGAIAGLYATLFALGVAPSPFKSATGTISGVVTDLGTGKPVPEATIEVMDNVSRAVVAEPVPDAKGNWKEKVKPGIYTVKAVCEGYHPSEKTASVAEGKTRIVNLAIAAAQGTQQSPGQASTSYPSPATVAGGPSGLPTPHTGSALPHGGQPATGTAAKTADQLAAEQYELGRNLAQQENWAGAAEAFEKAIVHDPSDGRLYANLIVCCMEQGNLAAAKDWADEGKKKAKKNLDALEQAAERLK